METLARRAGRVMLLGLLLLAPIKVLAECADYVTSGDGDDPMTGRLIGTSTLAMGSQQTITGSFNTRLSGGSYQYQKSTLLTVQVGTYEMSDGTYKTLRCDNYNEIDIG